MKTTFAKAMAVKIGIDARFFGPRDRGIGRYTENLIRNLEKIDSPAGGNQYFIFLTKGRWEEYQPANQNFKKILVRRPFGLLLKKYNLDLMHFTFYKVPIFYRKRLVLTVHDLTWQRFPIFNSLKRLVYKMGFKLAIKKAEKIIAVSEYVKEDIIKTYRANPDKIKVIYEGIG
jgi:glycosyltransferase involved in cell wall biosynthesis